MRTNLVIGVLCLCATLVSCDSFGTDNRHAYFLLYPSSSLEAAAFGQCKKLVNCNKKVIDRISYASKEAWEHAGAMPGVLEISNCAPHAEDDGHPYLLLGPRSSVQATYFAQCKKLINHSKKAVAYIPVGSEEVWQGFTDHTDKRGFKALEVLPCVF